MQWSKTLLAVCLIMTIIGSNRVFAAEPQKDAPAPPAIQEPPPPPEAMTEGVPQDIKAEFVDHILVRIKETDPQKADELAQLRTKDPNAFRSELRKHMKERMGQMMDRKDMPGPGQWQYGPGTPMSPEGFGPEAFRQRMQEWGEQYMKWLKENYPDDAAKLEQLKKENPEQFFRAMALSGKKYGRIFEASKDNPKLAQVLKDQLSLKEKRAELVRQIKATTDEKQKKSLNADLEKIVGQQFDLIVKRKQFACEDLTKKLTDLSKELDQKKADIEKWKNTDFKNQKVKERVNELLTESEKFEWE